ncbi:MAG: hypothetical protein OFPI_08430 [Osedax symbiont Rs2]|nr:MAG: hypothetical protein OFPI_08430 [Osedax symbiont Rs2]
MKQKLLISTISLFLTVSFILLSICIHDKNVSDKQLALIDNYHQQMHIGSEYWQHNNSQWQSYPTALKQKFLEKNIVDSIFRMFEQQWQQCGTLILFGTQNSETKYLLLLKDQLPVWALMLSKT